MFLKNALLILLSFLLFHSCNSSTAQVEKSQEAEDYSQKKKIETPDKSESSVPADKTLAFHDSCLGSNLTCDTSTSKKFEDLQKQAIQEVKSILNEVEGACDLRSPQSEGPCKRVQIGFSAKQEAKLSSKGQRILIMDRGFIQPGILRYSPRVLDIVENQDADGRLKTTTKTLETFYGTKQIFHDLIGGKYIDLPGVLFKELAGERAIKGELKKVSPYRGTRIVSEPDDAPFGGHGTMILNKLASYNPKAEFVLLDFSNESKALKLAGIDFCKAATDPSQFDLYEKFVKNSLRSILALIERYEINFLSLSLSTWKGLWIDNLRSCERILPDFVAEKFFQIEYESFFKPLREIEGVAVVQAVNNRVDFYNPNRRSEFPMACSKVPNQLRVGVFGSLDSGIARGGTGDVSKIVPENKRMAVPCVDMVVNVGTGEADVGGDEFADVVWDGCDQSPCTHWDQRFGIGLGGRLNASSFSNSNAVAVALSYLIYLKNTLPENTSVPELIRIATGEGKNFIQDPIRHRQIEVYRLGDLDP